MIDASTTVGARDLDTLPTLFRMFASEIRDSLARLETIIPSIGRIEKAIGDLSRRVLSLEQRQDKTDDRLSALEARYQDEPDLP